MKKYNVIKRIEVKGKEPQSYYVEGCRSIYWSQAVQGINDAYDIQKSAIFQDVSDLFEDCECPYFEVINNGVKIVYLVEESIFDEIAELTRPKPLHFKFELN